MPILCSRQAAPQLADRVGAASRGSHSWGRRWGGVTSLHWFPRVAVTNHHNLGGSESNIFSPVRGQKLILSCQPAGLPLGPPGENPFLPLPTSGGCGSSLLCGCTPVIPPSILTLLLFCLSSLCLLPGRTHGIAFRVHSHYPEQSPHLKILNFITSQSSALPDKVTFTASKD